MRLVLTRDDRIGVLRDGGMVDVSGTFADVRYRTAADRMPRILAMFQERRPRIEEMAARGRLCHCQSCRHRCHVHPS
jgi:hypothetical protein